jgi:nucleoside phosphorylase
MQTALDANAALSAGLQGAGGPRARQLKVANTLAITTDDGVARAVYPATGLQAENLEIFPIALACRAADIPFSAVLSVTNMVGSTGRVDWQQFQRDAALVAAEVAVTWLRQGAPGLAARPAY